MQKEVYLSVQIPEAQSGKLSLNIEGKAEYEQNGEKQILSVEESRETEILPLKADFRVTKTADRTRAVPGDEIVFQICIQNTGERTLHSVVTTEKFRLKNVPVKFLEGEGLTLNKDRTKARIEKIDPGYSVGLLAIVTLPEDIDEQKLINEVTVTTAARREPEITRSHNTGFMGSPVFGCVEAAFPFVSVCCVFSFSSGTSVGASASLNT